MAFKGSTTVLIVDDDPQIRDLFARFLHDVVTVVTVATGDGALDAIGPDTDVVLLDRRLDELAGEEVLTKLREAGHDQPVALVTGVQPDVDILDMGFDQYLLKPVTREELREAVDTLLLVAEYDELSREYFSLASKLAALEPNREDENVISEYVETMERLESIDKAAKRALQEALEQDSLEPIMRALGSGPAPASHYYGIVRSPMPSEEDTEALRARKDVGSWAVFDDSNAG